MLLRGLQRLLAEARLWCCTKCDRGAAQVGVVEVRRAAAQLQRLRIELRLCCGTWATGGVPYTRWCRQAEAARAVHSSEGRRCTRPSPF